MPSAREPAQPVCSVCGARPAARLPRRGAEADPPIEVVADGVWRRRFAADAGDRMCEECSGSAQAPESVD